MYIFFHSHRMHQTCSGNKPDSTQVCERTCLKFTFSLIYIYIYIISYYEHKFISGMFQKILLNHIFKHFHFYKNCITSQKDVGVGALWIGITHLNHPNPVMITYHFDQNSILNWDFYFTSHCCSGFIFTPPILIPLKIILDHPVFFQQLQRMILKKMETITEHLILPNFI